MADNKGKKYILEGNPNGYILEDKQGRDGLRRESAVQEGMRRNRTKHKKTAEIGHIGKEVVFETSDKKILIFSKMQRTVKGRWASHPRIGKKPKRQFLGPDTDQLTFTITLNAGHGVKPRKTVENIERLIRTGKPQTVVIGKKKVGSNKYVVTEMSENWETIMNRGEVVKITCDITLEEYL